MRCPPRTLGPLPPIACAYARVSKSKEGGRRCLDTRLTHASTHVAFKHVAFSHPYTRLYIHPHGHTHTHTHTHTHIHTHTRKPMDIKTFYTLIWPSGRFSENSKPTPFTMRPESGFKFNKVPASDITSELARNPS